MMNDKQDLVNYILVEDISIRIICYVAIYQISIRLAKIAIFENEGAQTKSFIFLQSFYIVLQPWGLLIAKTVSFHRIPNIAFNCR